MENITLSSGDPGQMFLQTVRCLFIPALLTFYKNLIQFIHGKVKPALFKDNNPDSKTLVILTSGQIDKPLYVYDSYDARSEIENGLFREAKQAWFIEHPPINTKAGFMVHVYLTIFVMALTTAFR